jgi:putative acetyltransferase
VARFAPYILLYLDIEFLYSSPHFSRQGIASELFNTAKSHLAKNGVTKLSTDASLEAMPLFKAKGFEIIQEQQVERHGKILPDL